MKKHTQKSVRNACVDLAGTATTVITIGRVRIERAHVRTPFVSLGNVLVAVWSDGKHITSGRFNQVIGAILHEANRA